jgi:hypothetical protein
MQSGMHSAGRKAPTLPPGRPQLSSKPPTAPGAPGGRGMSGASYPSGQMGVLQSGGMSMPNQGYGYAPQAGSPVAAPSRSNALVLVLIAILLAAIGVLAYLVLTK